MTDGEPVVFREFLSELISAKGAEPPTRSVPGWIAKLAARRPRPPGACSR